MACIQDNHSQEYEKAIDYIFDLIKDGTLKVGSKLPPERAIAEKLGIGRNSTREAISILHGMGFIDRVHGSGNYVSKNVGQSMRDTIQIMLALGSVSKEEIFEFRRVMDKAICNILLEHPISEAQKEDMEEILATMQQADGDALAQADKQFHGTLIIATGNHFWITLMEAVSEVYHAWIDDMIEHADDAKREELIACHEAIYTHLVSKEPEKMIQAVDRHYDLIEKML